jgi:DNA-binding response OmpR family regulator
VVAKDDKHFSKYKFPSNSSLIFIVMKILIVEDNIELAKNIEVYLKSEGNVCEVAGDLEEAIDKVVSFGYEMLVLDIMLPGGSGLEVIDALRGQNSEAGVLIISAKNALEDKIKGLDIGADDYLTKPFHLSELNARIKAIFRRKKLGNRQEVEFREMKIDTTARTLTVNGKPVDLTQKEFELILFLVTNKDRVLTRQSIAEHLWGDYVDSFDTFDFVYQHIKNLRKRISRAGGKDYIQTVYGLGYKFSSLRS